MKRYHLSVHMARNEWSKDRQGRLMEELAFHYTEINKDKIGPDDDILVEVWEHGGWWVAYNKAGLCVGSANDAAHWSDEVRQWWDRYRGAEQVYLGTVRREPQ